jgi:hypothetical protein
MVYGLGGLQRLEGFAHAATDGTADRLVEVFLRSRTAAMVTSLHNPSSSIVLEIRTALPEDSKARSFQAVSTGDARAYRFRTSGSPRTSRNSLMLEIQASKSCYITIIDVDTQGKINVLFPNEYQDQGFHPDGLIPGDGIIRIPDSLDGTKAGFAWDCVPPAGIETILVFGADDLRTAKTFRQYVAMLASRDTGTRSIAEAAGGGKGAEDPLHELREELARRWSSRGFKAVGTGMEAAGKPETVGYGTGDWNTASVTVLVED